MGLSQIALPFSLCFLFSIYQTLADERRINLHMPDVRPEHDESYLCLGKRLNPSREEFIVAFEPNASASKVHHILIYGCEQPGRYVRDTPNYIWECGEMNLGSGDESTKSSFDVGSPCGNGGYTTILFAWALDAPAIELDPQVGFRVSGDSRINYLVLQVHYGNTEIFRLNPGVQDNSGIVLHTRFGQDHGITKLAGIYLLVSYGYVIKGKSNHTMECTMSENKEIHPFRFRTHTHKLGVKVGGYMTPGADPQHPVLIGEHDPQQPQMFYHIQDRSMTIKQGDKISAYCFYNNTRDHTVFIGATGNDEMCNFYLMYWTEGNELLKRQDCMQYNPH